MVLELNSKLAFGILLEMNVVNFNFVSTKSLLNYKPLAIVACCPHNNVNVKPSRDN